jgi:mRNA-degrading endonuclease toxin of MazEF toxin-antitoxin module
VKRGEIWLVDLEPKQGRGQRGRRPVLLVSPDAFNRTTQTAVVLPITTGGGFARRTGFAVPVEAETTAGVVRCDQPRILDLEARRGRRVDLISEEGLQEVLARVSTLFA